MNRTELLRRELRSYLFEEEKKLEKIAEPLEEQKEEQKEVYQNKEEYVRDFADNANNKENSDGILFEVVGAVLRFLGLWAACCLIIFVLIVLELVLQGQIQL